MKCLSWNLSLVLHASMHFRLTLTQKKSLFLLWAGYDCDMKLIKKWVDWHFLGERYHNHNDSYNDCSTKVIFSIFRQNILENQFLHKLFVRKKLTLLLFFFTNNLPGKYIQLVSWMQQLMYQSIQKPFCP